MPCPAINATALEAARQEFIEWGANPYPSQWLDPRWRPLAQLIHDVVSKWNPNPEPGEEAVSFGASPPPGGPWQIGDRAADPEPTMSASRVPRPCYAPPRDAKAHAEAVLAPFIQAMRRTGPPNDAVEKNVIMAVAKAIDPNYDPYMHGEGPATDDSGDDKI